MRAARTSWRPSYMRSASRTAKVNKEKDQGTFEPGPTSQRKSEYGDEIQDLASTRAVSSLGDRKGKRKPMGIAEVLLPPQIIPNMSKHKVGNQQEISAW